MNRIILHRGRHHGHRYGHHDGHDHGHDHGHHDGHDHGHHDGHDHGHYHDRHEGRQRGLKLGVLLAVLLFGTATRAGAQVRPDLEWRTISTEHFRIHFTPELEALAGRTAANAEAAYARLVAELVAPRGIVDVVLADNVDYTNGYATPFPSNRIVLYARPPVDVPSLRNHEDWNLILLTHELAHIFHLDRAKGWWGLAQRVFGRAPPLFPNTYSPAWVTEGIAVHFESRFSDAGRLNGTEFPAMARAAALGGVLPPLDAVSAAAPRFPGATSAYLYGAYAMTHTDPLRMRLFVERSSERLLPWHLDANAKAAFGETFTRAWERWRDSVNRSVPESPLDESVRVLTSHGFTARFPRFVSDTSLVYLAEDGRETTGLYALSLSGARTRLGRRAGVDAPARLPDGRWLQAEYEYVDPYTLRSDLTIGNGLTRRRLTRGDRLASPDVHAASGRIVAVRTEPGTTSVVEVDVADAFAPRVIERGTLDRAWSEPRWSRDGTRIAAARWERGGRTSIVVMDDRGVESRAFSPRGPRLTIVSSPVWELGDTTLLFVSDHEGRAMIYRGDVRSGAYGRVWGTATMLETPDLSPDGRRIAAVELHADGYRVVTRAMPEGVALTMPPDDPADTTIEANAGRVGAAPPEPVLGDAQDRLGARYRPAESLWPKWWLPIVVATGTGNVRLGGMTNGRDVVGRHAYAASVSLELENAERTLYGVHTYGGFGNPVVTSEASMEWQHATIYNNNGNFTGYLARRTLRFASTAVVRRSRVRMRSYALGGGEFEQYDHRTYPPLLLGLLGDPRLESATQSAAAVMAVGVSTLRQPQLAISPEDGFELNLQHRERFNAGLNFEEVSETIVSTAFAKSLPLPGFSKHVLAVRGAYAVTGHAASSGFDAGGVSGSTLELLPGFVIGTSRRSFGVRGFAAGSQVGVRAAAANFEYRAPLTLLGRGVRLLPVYFQKASITGFADVGAAWCTRAVPSSFLCRSTNVERVWMQSLGAELALDASLHYDTIYRFRFGYAHPTRGRGFAQRAHTVYFTLGSSF